MINPLDDLDFSSGIGNLDELEKLAGFSPASKGENIIKKVAGNLTKKKTDSKITEAVDPLAEKHWETHKKFAQGYEKFGRPFALFVGDLLDIILSGPVQTKLVNEMIEEKINKMRKSKEASSEPSTHKVNVPAKRSAKYDVSIGGEKRVFVRHFLKRKGFLAALFLDSEEYPAFKKLIKQIETVCREEITEKLPEQEEARKTELTKIIKELKFEIKPVDVIKAWALLEADNFKHLNWVYDETKNLHLVRPNFYDDLDKAYRDVKKLIKLLIAEFNEEFPPHLDKQDAIEDYLKDILEVYTHHHFVLKFFNQTRPSFTLKDFEMTREELQEKIEDLREESNELRKTHKQTIIEKDQANAEQEL